MKSAVPPMVSLHVKILSTDREIMEALAVKQSELTGIRWGLSDVTRAAIHHYIIHLQKEGL